MSTNNVQGALAGLVAGGGAKLDAGQGGNEYARQSQRANAPSTNNQSNFTSQAGWSASSFSDGYNPPPIFNQAALSNVGSEPYEGFRSDIEFWFGKADIGSGYMH